VIDALTAWAEVQQLERSLRDDWQESDLVFTTDDGARVKGQWASVRFEILSFRAGVPPVRFHDLRHGTASLLKASGADSKMIAAMLGAGGPPPKV
jgi:integrase